MSTKVKRKVTVENTKDDSDQPRRPSVFERLGPGTVNLTTQPADRHSRTEQNEKCRNWLRTGNCAYGNTCRYKHDIFPSSSRRSTKSEKDAESKDLRHKVKTRREEPKESRTSSASPKRKTSKRSISRSRKGEHESKIKSTVVVTRPRSPSATATETTENKKKPEGNWEDDSDDWPMDAAQLDYKEELTLERKRQQLQRELELELQKERLLSENVTITKTVSFSESSSTSSSSDSGSISSSTESSSSSSDEDSNDSSSSSTSSSSSSSHPPVKKKNKKSFSKETKPSKSKQRDDYDKIKNIRGAKAKKNHSPSPVLESRKSSRKGRDKNNLSPSSPSRKRHPDIREDSVGRSNLNVRLRGPRTPSPVLKTRKQRQWAQSSSADSRSADVLHNKGKRHKKKKDVTRSEKRKPDRVVSPPPLSSPNRTAVMPAVSSKKAKTRDDVALKSRHRHREASPPLPRSGSSSQSIKLMGTSRYLTDEKPVEKVRGDERSKYCSRKEEDLLSSNRADSRERGNKRTRISPRKNIHKDSLSPHKDRYDSDMLSTINQKMYPHEKEKMDRRRTSISPMRSGRRRFNSEGEKKKDDISSREHESRRDQAYHGNEPLGYEKRGSENKKRFVSPDMKKNRDEKGRDHVKDKNSEYDSNSWQGDHRKLSSSSTGRRTPESRGRPEIHSQPSSLSRNDRSRERETERKKSNKKRDLSARSVEDADRARLPSPRRSQSPIHSHHAIREIESLTGNRGRMYDSDIPTSERDYGYSYDSLHDSYLSDRLLPSDYESDVLRGSSVYPSDVYPESRYRRGGKELLDRYEPRDVMSPRNVLPHRDIINLTGRGEDYLPDLPMDDRAYDDRWPRGRGRDDWDPYASLPPAPLPPHVAAALDEDRYGMPRRRRASPDWQRNRVDDRDPGISSSHRQSGRGQGLSAEGRSRSPKGPGASRGSWSDRGGRHDSRSGEGKQYEDSQKERNLDDRKGRNIRKDRGKLSKEEPLADEKIFSVKEKNIIKRPHSPSPSPSVKAKKRRNDTQLLDMRYHGNEPTEKISSGPTKKVKEIKSDAKSFVGRNQKSGKQDVSPPKIDNSERCEPPFKTSIESKVKEKEERKSRKNDDGARRDDDFSDWSDDDDELLTRDDFVEIEQSSENNKDTHKMDENIEEGSNNSRRKEKHGAMKDTLQDLKKEKDTGSSRDRSNEEIPHSKEGKSVIGKETDAQESLSLKEDTATDVDEYVTAESVDYDPISDDELDALIEEPDDTLIKPTAENEKSKIVNALEVDWSTLMSETKTADFIPGCARQRFKAVHVLSRIGFSQVFAGPELSEKIVNICQKQLEEEEAIIEDEAKAKEENKKKKKFTMEHPLAAFHVAISRNKQERANLLNKVGPCRRALCARRDLHIRKVLCRPLNKLNASSATPYTPQFTVVDKELYKQSLELLKLKKPLETQPQTVDVC